MLFDVDMVYTKILALKAIYSFVN